MKCIWAIEDYETNTTHTKELIEEVKKQGHNCYVCSYVPFRSGKFDEIPYKEAPVFFQGSINLAKQFQDERPEWKPGVIATWNKFSCLNYYDNVKEYLFNKDFDVIKTGDLLNEKWNIYRKYGQDATIWLRPDSGEKPFTARILELEDFDNFYNKWIKDYTGPDDFIIVSSPKKINGEWRYICSNNEILGVSSYSYQGNNIYIASAPTKATELCNKILDHLNKNQRFPDPFFALDICETPDGEHFLMEFNAVSTCGLYKCNKEKIVKSISEYADKVYST
jgi:hypothetical protein